MKKLQIMLLLHLSERPITDFNIAGYSRETIDHNISMLNKDGLCSLLDSGWAEITEKGNVAIKSLISTMGYFVGQQVKNNSTVS